MGFGCRICDKTLYEKTRSSLVVGATSKVERPVVATKCGHLYHHDCLKNVFLKQGIEVWTIRHCPKCNMSLTVATDVIRIFTHAATDELSDDLDEANIRIKKLQSDKKELVNRLETSFLQGRDTQKNYNKLEKELIKRKSTEANMREDIANLRKENEELKNTVVRISKNMTRVEPHNAGGFMTGPVMPPPQHPSQFYGGPAYPVGYGPHPNFVEYPHPYAMGENGMVPNEFRPYGHGHPHTLPYKQMDGGRGQMFHSSPSHPPRLSDNKANGKNKYDYYNNPEYNKSGQQRKPISEKYGNTKPNSSSDNEVSSDSETEITRKSKNIRKENGKSAGEDSSPDADKILELRNVPTSPPNFEKKSEMERDMDKPDDSYFDQFYKNHSEGAGVEEAEKEQSLSTNRFANQNLDERSKRIFGRYRCTKCGSKWGSARAESNQLQKCLKCKTEVYPYQQGPVLSKLELRATRKGY